MGIKYTFAMALSGDGAAEGPYDMMMKILMIGDSGVGKTCLLLKYTNNSFSSTFITTIGIDFKQKTLDLRGKKIRLQLWDTAGQERFQSLGVAFYRMLPRRFE